MFELVPPRNLSQPGAPRAAMVAGEERFVEGGGTGEGNSSIRRVGGGKGRGESSGSTSPCFKRKG